MLMKRIVILIVLYSLIFTACHDDEIYIKEEDTITQQDKESLQSITDFFKFDQTVYEKLLGDAEFLLLCDRYKDLRDKILLDTTFLAEQKQQLSDTIFIMTKTLSKKYSCKNLFNYTLYKLNYKALSRAHDWGQCYFHPDGNYVCDTYENWQKAWRECARFEVNADLELRFKLDVFKYRTAQLAYLLHICRSCGHIYRQFANIDRARVGDYTYAEMTSLQTAVDEYIKISTDRPHICYEIKSLESNFTDFFYSRAWTSCISGESSGGTTPEPNPYDSIWQGGGGGIIPQPDPDDGVIYATIIGPNQHTLMDKYSIMVSIKCTDPKKEIPRIATVSFEIKAHSGFGNWKTLEGQPVVLSRTAVYKRTAIAPGFWDVQAVITLEGLPGEITTTNALVIEEMYPERSKFENQPVVQQRAVGLWNKAVTFATANKSKRVVREYGCLIYLDTKTGTYSCGSDILGDTVTLDRSVEATVRFSYSERLPDPREGGKYEVGTLHSHYPLTWAIKGARRSAGPSTTDNNGSLPGFVYDYTKDVVAGDPVDIANNPKVIYSFGPSRRASYQW